MAPIAKPEPRAKVKARQKRQDDAARRACCDAVWARAGHRCESCGTPVKRSSAYWFEVGHVDELVRRSQGGNPHDPAACRLACPKCHMAGPSGAHRVTKNWRQDAALRATFEGARRSA